jgi:hypothetical protein
MRMSEAIAHARRHERETRPDPRQEFWRRRRAAPMMTDFEDVRAHSVRIRRGRREDARLFFTLRIADEQHRAMPEREPKDEAVVVRSRIQLERRTRRDHVEPRAAELSAIAELCRPHHARAARTHHREKPRVRAGRAFVLALPRVPQLVDIHPAQAFDQAQIVIGMRVREDDRAQRRDASLAKQRRDHALPHVDGASHEPSAIDQHRFSVRQLHERGVALTDVELRERELTAARQTQRSLCDHEQRHAHDRDEATPLLREQRERRGGREDRELHARRRWHRE